MTKRYILDTGSLSYEFRSVEKKLKKSLQKLGLRRSGGTFGDHFWILFWTPLGTFFETLLSEKFLRNHRNPGLEMKLRATFVELTHVTSAIRCDDFGQSGSTLGCKECFAPLPCKVYLVIL